MGLNIRGRIACSLVLGCSLMGALEVQALAFPAALGEAPTSNLALTVSAIQSAKQSLEINIYEMTSPQIKDAIVKAIQSGVQVTILEEGSPVGGFSTGARAVASDIVEAMKTSNQLLGARRASNRFFIMKAPRGVTRRFRFDHAKYIIVDRSKLLIGSENYSPTGQFSGRPQSVQAKAAPSKGNRGWEVFLSDASLAGEFLNTFTQDTDQSFGDIMDAESFLGSAMEVETAGDASDNENDAEGDENDEDNNSLDYSMMDVEWNSPLEPIQSEAELGLNLMRSFTGLHLEAPLFSASAVLSKKPKQVDVEDVEIVRSPDTSLPGLQRMIRSAVKNLDLELMTFDLTWGGPGKSSPLFEEVVKAAKRGVRVRVLLNDERAFAKSAKQKNLLTVNALNQAASKGGLNITAAVANLGAMGVKIIHNKGALIDGNRTLISSINWNRNSVENNRETAVILTSAEAYAHYQRLFEHDLAVSLEAAH